MNTTGKEFSVTEDIIQLDQAFPNPWTREQWYNLDFHHHLLFSVRNQSDLNGYALFQAIPGDDTAHLLKIMIEPHKRGTAISKEFWNEILVHLRSLNYQSIYLEVEASNSRAIRFYEKSGFKLLRKNKAYYSNGEDALIMTMTL